MPRTKKPETLLKEALESGDNLEILKAHRKVIVNDILSIKDENERKSLHSSLTQISKEIIKLEGIKRDEEGKSDIEKTFESIAGNLMSGDDDD